MATNLGTIGAGGAQGAQEAFDSILARRLKEALQKKADEQQKFENDRKLEQEKIEREKLASAEKDREQARRDRLDASEGASFGSALGETVGQQDVTPIVDRFKRSQSPIVADRMAGLQQIGDKSSLPSESKGATASFGEIAPTGDVRGPGIRYVNPKPAPREVNPQEPTRVSGVMLSGQFDPSLKGKRGVQVYTPDMKTLQKEIQEPEPSTQGANNEMDRSYKLHVDKIDALKKPVADRAERLTRLADTLRAGTPVADSVIAPELITSMAGGLGSGVRITNAEIQAVVGGRNHWQNLSAALDKWNNDPNHAYQFTPEQRQQMATLINHISDRAGGALNDLDEAGTSLSTAKSVAEHRKIYNDLKLKLSAHAQGKDDQDVPQEVAAEFAKVPKGKTGSIDWQGKTYRIDAQGQVTVR